MRKKWKETDTVSKEHRAQTMERKNKRKSDSFTCQLLSTSIFQMQSNGTLSSITAFLISLSMSFCESSPSMVLFIVMKHSTRRAEAKKKKNHIVRTFAHTR